ncbi:glycosyltransferase [Haloarcula onubensis]|uniref:Glycosyl transferase family 28 C-terminal domain-containing protein n=1 Tax=Haloarcula onubensis TaxID=2950539 RepID=A0ABU2FK42_9EURY|nr:glycosyltransferase [Halomicroarcula sp. S3CR25-11]MDS0280789.1 hypothetical protein [Halomicroarcula sp. S3CR25-11]
MIFGTVGTHDQPFDRLLSGLDELAHQYDGVVAQVGHSTYRPENMEWFDFVSESEINDYYRNASVVVGHAGAGTILTALSYGKPLVLMPRRKQYDEHLDDHQLELTDALRDRDGVFVAETTDELDAAIDDALAHTQTTTASSGELATYLSANIDRMVD